MIIEIHIHDYKECSNVICAPIRSRMKSMPQDELTGHVNSKEDESRVPMHSFPNYVKCFPPLFTHTYHTFSNFLFQNTNKHYAFDE